MYAFASFYLEASDPQPFLLPEGATHPFAQVYTGQVPWGADVEDSNVRFAVLHKALPDRPTEEQCGGKAVVDEVWALLESCWETEPSERPSMTEVVKTLEAILNT